MAKKESKFKTWDDVAGALGRLREIELERRRAEILMNDAIRDIKERYSEKTAQGAAEKEELEKETELFVKAHKAEFEEKRTREFAYGKVGFRRTTEIVTRNVKAIIGALRQYNMAECINVKESIDKDALAKYDDEALKTVGASRKEKDKYFCEISIDGLEG